MPWNVSLTPLGEREYGFPFQSGINITKYFFFYPFDIFGARQKVKQLLPAGAATVLFFEFQIGIDDFIIAIKTGYIIIEPDPEFV